jgi:hypothetical protein
MEEDRLCEACGWWGDKNEVLITPPEPEEFNPVLAASQVLAMYRDVCRNELIAEQVFDAGDATEADLRKVRLECRDSVNSIIEMFAAFRKVSKNKLVLEANGLLGWPDEWTDRHHNACNEPCDFLVGPCACGAWHTADEQWVKETLANHNAEIVANED